MVMRWTRKRSHMILLSVVALLAASLWVYAEQPGWKTWRQNEARTGLNAGSDGQLVVKPMILDPNQTPAPGQNPSPESRWVYPHDVPNPSNKNKPFLPSIGTCVASPAAGNIQGDLFVVIFASIDNYEIQPAGEDGSPAVNADLGTVYCFDAIHGIDAGSKSGNQPFWWYGTRDVPFDPTNAISTAEHTFLRAVSKAVAASAPGLTPDQRQNPDPMGPVRSTPTLYHLPNPLQYTSTWVDLDGRTKDSTFATSDIVVFGSDDGFVYCLDASPSNAITYSQTDSAGQIHSTRVARCIWRYDTRSLLKPGDTTQYVQVISSPLVLQLAGKTTVVIGTGTGYLVWLNAADGTLVRSFATGPLAKNSSGEESSARQPVTSSPALGQLASPDGSSTRPIIIFGAADSVVYAVDANTGAKVWTYITGELPAGPADPNRDPGSRMASTGLFNPPVLATPAVGMAGDKQAVFIATTGRRDKKTLGDSSPAGVVYALELGTGKEIWKFDSYRNPSDSPSADPNLLGEFKASPALASVPIWGVDGGRPQPVVILKSEDGNLYCVYAKDGTPAWLKPFTFTGENTTSDEVVASSPVVSSNGLIWIGGRDGILRAFDPSKQGTFTDANGNTVTGPGCSEEWRVQTGTLTYTGDSSSKADTTPQVTLNPGPIYASPAITNGFLFIGGTGYFHAFQDTNGAYGIPFVPNTFAPGGVSPAQRQTPQGAPGSTTDIASRIQVDIFSQANYRNRAVTLDLTHSQALGVTGDGNHRWTVVDPGRVEWGDTIYVIAWNLDTNPAVNECQLRLQGPNGTIQVTVPVRTGTANLVGVEKQGVARYAFTLDPITQTIVNPLRPKELMPNPFFDQPLTPGGEGTGVWTVTASQYGTRLVGTATVKDTSKSITSNNDDTKSRFKINNPIEIYDATGQALTKQFPDEATRNANLHVPTMPPVVGDHDSTTLPQTFRVADRSHLYLVRQYNGDADAPEGTLPAAVGTAGVNRPYLRVKVAPAELQWLGGPEAVYKPMFPYFPNGATAYPGSANMTPLSTYEEPPGRPGVPNQSQDYPNIKAENVDVRTAATGTDAVHTDIPLPNASSFGASPLDFAYRVRIPRYQPANVEPWGPGYATINPTNADFTNGAALLVGSSGPMVLPTYKPSYPTDNTYLARVYVDTNRNGSHDYNEAFRAFIMRCEVRVNESFEVRERAVDIPGPVPGQGPPPPGVPHGFVPYTNYWPGTNADQLLLQAEAPFYRPFTIVNTGNVNLWNIRMAKSPDVVDPLLSASVDPAFAMAGGKGMLRGAIGPENLFSTLDVPFGLSRDLQRFYRPGAPKARVNAPDGQPMVMVNPFDAGRGMLPPRPCITVAVPPGTPVGKYVTQPVFFEDGAYVYTRGGGGALVGDDGIALEQVKLPNGAVMPKAIAPKTFSVAVEVMENRLTGFPPLPAQSGSPRPFLPANVDVQATAASNAVPAAYRDETGLHVIWSTNRATSTDANTPPQWYLYFSTLPVAGASPWGWSYANMGRWFFEPAENAQWWKPAVGPFPDPARAGSLTLFGSPAVVENGDTPQTVTQRWLFFQGESSSFDPATGYSQRSGLFYVQLKGGAPTGPVLEVPGDQQTQRQSPRPFFFRDDNGRPMLGVVWHSGNPPKLFVSSTSDPTNPSSWSAPVSLPLPASLAYALQPAPFFKGNVGRYSYMDLVFSGYSRAEQNADLYLMRLRTSSWEQVPLPRVTAEQLQRQPQRPVYQSVGLDWQLTSDAMPVIRWTRPSGQYIEFTTPDSVDPATGTLIYRDSSGHYTVTVDASAGVVRFSTDDPVGFPVPRNNDLVQASYTPGLWRLTNDPRADTQPIYFIDRSAETIAPGEPYRVDGSLGNKLPLLIRRDRMWVIWRKGNTSIGGGQGGGVGIGTTGSSTLFYKTYRLMVKLPSPVPVHPQKHVPLITVEGVPPDRWTVDPGTGRVFFTEQDEGKTVKISLPNSAPIVYTISWQPEMAGNAYQEFPVPIKTPVNEGQVWAFKDPFSYVQPASTDVPVASATNDVWLFWTSSRGGTSDIYYMAISPRF